MNIRWPLALVVMWAVLLAAPLRANPSHKSLDAMLAVHGQEFSPELLKIATGFYDDASRKLLNFLEHEKKHDLQKIGAEDLGASHVLVTRLRRAGAQLRLLGEPTGVDCELRGVEMHHQMGRLINSIQAVPATQKYIEAFRQFITRSAAARAKSVQELERLISQKKFEAAETELYKVYDRLEMGTIYLSPAENTVIYQPFAQVSAIIIDAMRQARIAKADELLRAAVAAALPSYPQIVGEINTAVGGVGSSGTANWKDQSVDGPQLVDRIAQKWRETEAAALQARGRSWALDLRNGIGRPDPATLPTGTLENDHFAADYAAFCGEVTKSLVRLIELDAQRLSGEGAATQHVAYLRALAPLSRQLDQSEFDTSINAALGQLLAKHPTSAQQALAYEGATTELLRWRARVAAARAARGAESFAALDVCLREGTMSHQEQQIRGLFREPPAVQSVPLLIDSSPDVMTAAVPRLVGRKTAVRDVIRLPGESKSAIARYAGRTYANIPAPLNISGEVESLKSDLMVSDQASPLTLAAMRAVITAERGDVRAVGGEITGIYLESVVTRFAALPTVAAILAPLGQLPREPLEGDPLANMLMRFDVAPQWVWHDYFFVPLPPAAAE